MFNDFFHSTDFSARSVWKKILKLKTFLKNRGTLFKTFPKHTVKKNNFSG